MRTMKHRSHILSQPWHTGNGRTMRTCTVAGCQYTEMDGVAVTGRQQREPQAQQCAMFETWGDGSTVVIPDSSTFKPKGLGFDGDA